MTHLLEVMFEDLGVWGHVIMALLFAVLAERMAKLLNFATVHPALFIERIKAVDVTKPLTFFALQVVAVFVAVGIANALGWL